MRQCFEKTGLDHDAQVLIYTATVYTVRQKVSLVA